MVVPAALAAHTCPMAEAAGPGDAWSPCQRTKRAAFWPGTHLHTGSQGIEQD